MPRPAAGRVTCPIVELDGARYAILRESALRALCRRAGMELCTAAPPPDQGTAVFDLTLDDHRLGERVRQRRRQAGLTQADLARRAGIRVETLNRIERGHTTPDFGTLRKLVVAMSQAEAEQGAALLHASAGR
jgi:DNA-binding XRE family transcriptional regulator